MQIEIRGENALADTSHLLDWLKGGPYPEPPCRTGTLRRSTRDDGGELLRYLSPPFRPPLLAELAKSSDAWITVRKPKSVIVVKLENGSEVTIQSSDVLDASKLAALLGGSPGRPA